MPETRLGFITRTVLPYAVFAALWIYLSDRLLAALVTDPALHARLQTFKGMAFILVTTALLYWLLRRELQKRRRAESWRNGQNKVLTQLVSGAPLHTVLETVALTMETQVAGAIGSILLLDADARHLRFGAAPHLPVELSRALDGMSIGPAAGACGTAAHDRALVIIEDFETDPRGVDYRELSRRFRLRACWSQPVLAAGGEVLGTFAMYYPTARRPTVDEQHLIAEAGNLVAIVIETTRNRDALAESEVRFRATFEQAAVGIAHVAPDGRFLRINRKFCDIVGYRREEMLAGAFQDITHPDDLHTDLDNVKRVLAGEIPTYSMEKRYRHKNGSLVWVNLTVALVRKDDGAPDYFISVVEDIIARKQAEQALRDREQDLDAILENLPIMVFAKDATDLRFVRINHASEALLGVPREKLLGKSDHDFFPPEQAGFFVAKDRETLARGETVDIPEEPIDTPRGRRFLHTRKVVVRGPDGQPRYLLGISEDITERRRAAEALQQSEQRLRNIIDGLGPQMFVGLMTPEGTLLEANRPALAAAGLKPEDVLGKPVEQSYWWSYSEESRQRLHATVVRAAQGEGSRYDVQVRVGENRFIWIDFSLQPLRDETGKVRYLIGSANVITERKLAEEALREHEKVLRLFVEHSPAAIAMFDKEMRYLVTSRRWLEDYGLGDQHLIGRSHYEVFPEVPQRWIDIHRRCLAGAIERCEEDPFPRPDGHTDWVRWEARPWRQANNEIGGIIIFSEVITARKQAEQTIAENAERLARLSRQLLAAQETERRRVAHELHDEIGQLLTVVKLDLQTVLRQPGTTALAPALKEGMESIDRVVAQVRDLSLDLRPSMLDDLGLVPTLRWYVQRQAQRLGAGIEVALSLPPALPRLPGEIETACFRVAQEALTNTTRHAGATRIEVTLAAGERDLELTVHDNGSGFDAGAVRRRTAGGFGLLGMQERAELTGGQLTIISAPGQGTTVRARFPAVTTPEPTE